MSTSKKHARSENDIIDVENLTLPSLDDNGVEEHAKNAFDKLLNKENSGLLNKNNLMK